MMGLLDSVDRIVVRMGLYPAPAPRRRHLRWLPLLVLAMAAAGLCLQIAGEPGWAEPLTLLAFVLTALFVLIGPLRNPTAEAPLDEREKLMRTRASLAGTGTVMTLALGGAMLFSFSDDFPMWTPANAEDWRIIGYTMITVFWCVSQLHASWTTPPLDDDPD